MKCINANHNLSKIECICKYSECKQTSRFICSQCEFEATHNHQQFDNSYILNKRDYDQQQLEYIMNAKIDTKLAVQIATISFDLKYIIQGGNKILNIWDYQTYNLIKSINFNYNVYCCKFTDDSKILYVGTLNKLYQILFNNGFKRQRIMLNIYDFLMVQNKSIAYLKQRLQHHPPKAQFKHNLNTINKHSKSKHKIMGQVDQTTIKGQIQQFMDHYHPLNYGMKIIDHQ